MTTFLTILAILMALAGLMYAFVTILPMCGLKGG